MSPIRQLLHTGLSLVLVPQELAAADVGGVVHTVVHTYHDANPLNMFRVATGETCKGGGKGGEVCIRTGGWAS